MNRESIRIYETAYPNTSHTNGLAAVDGKQLQIHSIAAANGVSGAINVGLYNSVTSSQFKVWTVTASDAEVTSSIQAGSTISMFPTTNNYGVIVQSKERFNMITINISQASTGSPVYVYQYFNGSSWTTLNLLNSPAYSSTGIMQVVFSAPIDWVVGDSSNTTDNSMYSIKITASTAPSQAVQINSLKVCKALAYRPQVTQYGVVLLDMNNQPLLLQSGEAVIPYFSTANAANRLEIAYKLNP